MERPEIVNSLLDDYLVLPEHYVGYFEVPQEEAQKIAQYIVHLEKLVGPLGTLGLTLKQSYP